MSFFCSVCFLTSEKMVSFSFRKIIVLSYKYMKNMDNNIDLVFDYNISCCCFWFCSPYLLLPPSLHNERINSPFLSRTIIHRRLFTLQPLAPCYLQEYRITSSRLQWDLLPIEILYPRPPPCTCNLEVPPSTNIPKLRLPLA